MTSAFRPQNARRLRMITSALRPRSHQRPGANTLSFCSSGLCQDDDVGLPSAKQAEARQDDDIGHPPAKPSKARCKYSLFMLLRPLYLIAGGSACKAGQTNDLQEVSLFCFYFRFSGVNGGFSHAIARGLRRSPTRAHTSESRRVFRSGGTQY